MKLRRWTRRIVATATLVGAIGVGVATAVPAGASRSYRSCDGVYWTAYYSHGANNYSPGQADHACD